MGYKTTSHLFSSENKVTLSKNQSQFYFNILAGVIQYRNSMRVYYLGDTLLSLYPVMPIRKRHVRDT